MPTDLERMSEADHHTVTAGERKRMLVVVNPYATTVSEGLKNLIVYALQARYEVEAVETEEANHATRLAARAAEEGFDLVVAFGGDGTLNEVANGLAGSGTPVSVLPGGSTNVICRTLGIPTDLVDAAEHLIAIADTFTPRPMDLGVVNGRRFLFASGFGLDADVVRRVDEDPRMKSSAGKWFYAYSALSGFYSYCLGSPPSVRVSGGEADGLTGATAFAQNSSPFTYFGSRPIELCENVELDDGRLGLAVLERFAQRDVPSLIPRLLSSRLSVPASRRVHQESGIKEVVVEAIADGGGDAMLPLHVDGDFIGKYERAEWSVEPAALRVVY
ncbi:MAG: diacylglycerol/lipid kinase family protein [bacterium]